MQHCIQPRRVYGGLAGRATACVARCLSTTASASAFNQPRGGNEMCRAGGPGTFMRLPSADLFADPSACEGLDVAVVGIPLDTGTSFRTGCRFGPRQIRQESAMLRPYNMATRAAPFESLQVADCGDVPINTFHLEKSVDIITEWYTERILSQDTIPLTIGGDHTIALPLLRAMAAKHGHGKVGLVHVDAHADVNEHMFGEQIAHGTPFRRAVEENLLGAYICIVWTAATRLLAGMATFSQSSWLGGWLGGC
jgi:guanidinobutyrase